MIAVVRFMYKGIKQANNMSRITTLWPRTAHRSCLNLLQDFNLVESCLHVVRRTFLNFNCDVSAVLEVFAKPNSGEVSPA